MKKPWGHLPVCYTTSNILDIDLIVNDLIPKKLNDINNAKFNGMSPVAIAWRIFNWD